MMAHWIEATAEHNRRPVRMNADAIAYLVREHADGPTHVHFIGSNAVMRANRISLILETPDEVIKRIERPS